MALCIICRQPLTERHDHPHDHVGPLNKPCLACNKVHVSLTPRFAASGVTAKARDLARFGLARVRR